MTFQARHIRFCRALWPVSVAMLLLVAVAPHGARAQPAAVQGREAGSCENPGTITEQHVAILWDQGLLRFTCARLADVVAEYNRHGALKLAISDPLLADTLIGGAFRMADLEAFTAGLQIILDVRVERRGDTVWLMRKAERSPRVEGLH